MRSLVCELTLDEASVEATPTNSAAGVTAEPEPEPAAGSFATAATIVDSEPSAGFGPVSEVAARLKTKRHLPARASDRWFLPIEAEHYVMLLDWTGRELRAEQARGDSGSPRSDPGPAGVESIELGRDRGGFRPHLQASGGPIELAGGCRGACSRRWFQGKVAARAAFA